MAGRVLTIRNSESRAQQKPVSRLGIANSCKSVPGGLAGGDGCVGTGASDTTDGKVR